MKGRIEVESEPGVGSVFTVCIPVTRLQPGADADARDLGGLQLILVTPDKPLGDMVNMYLAPVGAMVAVFRSVDDPALAAALSDGNGANTIVFFDAVHAPADRSRRPLDDFRQLLGMRQAQSRMAVYAPSRLQARDRIDFAAANVAIFSVPLTQSRLREGLATMLGMQPPSEAQTPAAVADANLQTLAGLRVLSVDDVAMNNEVIAGMLTRLGVDAECVSSAYQALDRLAAGHYDVVLMDVHMDTMNGLEATRRIRAMDIEQPLIFGVSASVMEEDQRAGLESGMDAYLMKPFRLKDFVAAMAKQGFGNADVPEATAASAVADQSYVTRDLPLFIDIDDLRERLVDEALMRNSLSTFVRVYEKGADELEAALKGDDTDLSMKLVHRLKGAARSIGDHPIDRCAAEIEQRLKQGERRDEDVELVELLRQHLAALKPALAAPEAAKQMSDEAFNELLADLRSRYEASRFVPAETVDSLIDGLRERGLVKEADEIRTYVDRFEIDVLPELLAGVAERLS